MLASSFLMMQNCRRRTGHYRDYQTPKAEPIVQNSRRTAPGGEPNNAAQSPSKSGANDWFVTLWATY
jgi:hypothetical protein